MIANMEQETYEELKSLKEVIEGKLMVMFRPNTSINTILTALQSRINYYEKAYGETIVHNGGAKQTTA